VKRLLDLLARGPRRRQRETLPGSGADRPGSVWDQSSARCARDGFKEYWETLPQVSSYQAERMTEGAGEDVTSWALDLIRREVGRSGLRGLSLGCAEAAAPEMAFAASGLFDSVDVMDIAAGLLDRQRARALELGWEQVSYIRQDLEEVRLEPESYDVVWSIGTIHHLDRLEALFSQVNRALTGRGLFLMREYVGPDRLQLTELQLEVANRVLEWLPESYRRRWDGTLKEASERVDQDRLVAEDPSEAIRSSDIVRAMAEALEVERIVPTGGTLLMPLLEGIAARFEGSPEADALLHHLMEYEQLLISTGRLPSDFIFAIARKRPAQARTD